MAIVKNDLKQNMITSQNNTHINNILKIITQNNIQINLTTYINQLKPNTQYSQLNTIMLTNSSSTKKNGAKVDSNKRKGMSKLISP